MTRRNMVASAVRVALTVTLMRPSHVGRAPWEVPATRASERAVHRPAGRCTRWRRSVSDVPSSPFPCIDAAGAPHRDAVTGDRHPPRGGLSSATLDYTPFDAGAGLRLRPTARSLCRGALQRFRLDIRLAGVGPAGEASGCGLDVSP